MDPVTHALLGGTLGYALFARKLGRHATALGALSAVTPDIDHFVFSRENPLLYIEIHRSFTHSILFAVIGSLIAALPWILRKKFRPQWRTLWLCSFPAYLSHCFLDASTAYGTQLFWPFTNARESWDLISVVDPIFTLTLAAGLLLSLIQCKERFSFFAIGFCCAYIGFGAVQKSRVQHAQQQIAQQRGHIATRIRTIPTLWNIMVWRSLYEHDGKIFADRIRAGLFSAPTYWEGSSLPLLTTSDLIDVEKETDRSKDAFTIFSWFADGWVARYALDETVIADMRYSISSQPFDAIWGIRLRDRNGKPHLEWFNRTLKRNLNFGAVWREVTGQNPNYIPVPNRNVPFEKM